MRLVKSLSESVRQENRRTKERITMTRPSQHYLMKIKASLTIFMPQATLMLLLPQTP